MEKHLIPEHQLPTVELSGEEALKALELDLGLNHLPNGISTKY